jgi:hypothetical protein
VSPLGPADGKVALKIVPPRPRIPCWKGRCADSGEKHEPASDVTTVVVHSLKALDPNRPIREADSCTAAKASLFHPRPPAIAGGYVRRATGAALEEHSGAIITTISDVVRSSRNLVRYAGKLKSRLNEQRSFPRGAPRATLGRRGD